MMGWPVWTFLELKEVFESRASVMRTVPLFLRGWICKSGNRKQDKFLRLWWWTVVVSTTLCLVLRPLFLTGKTRNLAWKRLRSNRVSLSAARLVRWCHSLVLLGDVVTIDSDTARVSLGTVLSSWFSLEIDTRPPHI